MLVSQQWCADRPKYIVKHQLKLCLARSARAVEYTDYISANGLDFPNECPGYDNQQSDGGAPVMMELRGIRNTPLLPSLPGTLWAGMVAPDRVLSMGKIELKLFT